MRFLHLADVHLDTPFRGRSESLRTRLREALRQAFRRAVDRALEERVDAVVIAGDLFDGHRLSFRSERFLEAEMHRLCRNGVGVFYATGNHDPGELGSERSRIRWPEGVTIFRDPDPEIVDVTRNGKRVGKVVGAGHATARETRDLSRSFPTPDDESLPWIALLHTQVGGARGSEAHDPYAPSDLTYLRSAGYDYWALGHVHGRQVLSENPAVHYPGNLQGRHPGETGSKGALLVEIPTRGAPQSISFMNLAPVRWAHLRLDGLDGVTHLDGLVRRIAEGWKVERLEDPGEPDTEWIVRVELTGPCDLHRELGRREEVTTLEEELAGALNALDVELRADGLHPAADPAPYLQRQDAVGEALRLLQAILDGGAEDPAASLELAPEDLAGLEDELVAAYIRERVSGGDGELVSRFETGGEG